MSKRRALWALLVVGVLMMVGSVSALGWIFLRHLPSPADNPLPPDDFVRVIPPVTPLPPGTQPEPGQYIGCFKDTSAFDLDGFLVKWPTNNTPQHCMATCSVLGFRYAAVQYGESCLCGQNYGRYGPADNCDYPCPGDGNQMCGGYSANSIYRTGAK